MVNNDDLCVIHRRIKWLDGAQTRQRRRRPHRVQTDLLFPQASGHDAGRIHGLLREPALAAVETAGPRTVDSERSALCAPLSEAREESGDRRDPRSEEHTSELQSLMRISYAVFCLKKK